MVLAEHERKTQVISNGSATVMLGLEGMATIFAAGVGAVEKSWPTGLPANHGIGPPGLKLRPWIGSAGYCAALSGGCLARCGLDPFRMVRLGFACVDDVRRRVQQYSVTMPGE